MPRASSSAFISNSNTNITIIVAFKYAETGCVCKVGCITWEMASLQLSFSDCRRHVSSRLLGIVGESWQFYRHKLCM